MDSFTNISILPDNITNLTATTLQYIMLTAQDNQVGNASYYYNSPQPFGVQVLSYTGTSLGCVAILLNIVFLSCHCCIKNNDSAYNRMIQNLSICDILGCITFLISQNWPEGPFAHITAQHKVAHWWVQCLPYVFRSLPWMFFTAYMLTLNCLSMSQYLASCKPHVYMNVRMNKLVNYILLAIWLIASLQIMFPIMVLICLSHLPIQVAFSQLILISKVEMVVWMVIYTASTILCIVLNTKIFLKLRNLRQPCAFIQQSIMMGANTRAKNEAFITIACLCVASIFCRLPLPLVGMLLITIIERRFGPMVMNWTLAVVVLLLYLVFVVDPVIYIFRLHEARDVLYRAVQVVNCPSKLRQRYHGLNLKDLSGANISSQENTVKIQENTLTAQSTLL